MFTDIRQKGWIKALPEKAQPYAYLMRLDRPIGNWLLFWPGAFAIVLAAEFPEMVDTALTTLLLFAIGAPVMRAAGCTINDLWDRELDKGVERTAGRPIAAGDITPKQALYLLGGLLFLGLIILMQLPLTAVLLGFAALPLVILYPLMKRYTFWPQAFLGLTFNFAVLIGWAAIDITLPMEAFLLFLAGLFWTMGYDTIYAFQDIEDDLTIGVKSTAILFQDNPKPVIWIFYGAFAVLLGLVQVLSSGSAAAPLSLIPAIWYGGSLIYNWNPDSQINSLETFKANRWVGLLVFAGCVITALI